MFTISNGCDEPNLGHPHPIIIGLKGRHMFCNEPFRQIYFGGMVGANSRQDCYSWQVFDQSHHACWHTASIMPYACQLKLQSFQSAHDSSTSPCHSTVCAVHVSIGEARALNWSVSGISSSIIAYTFPKGGLNSQRITDLLDGSLTHCRASLDAFIIQEVLGQFVDFCMQMKSPCRDPLQGLLQSIVQ